MTNDIHRGLVLDERVEMSLSELSLACSSSTQWIIELVEEGIIEPKGAEQTKWRFSGSNLAQANSARRLHQDLEINLAGVALALELIDEIQELRSRLKRFE